MHPTPSPRHPFKAFVALLAMAAFVHGVYAQVRPHHGVGSHFVVLSHDAPCVVTTAGVDRDCDRDDVDDDDPDVPDAIVVKIDADDL